MGCSPVGLIPTDSRAHIVTRFIKKIAKIQFLKVYQSQYFSGCKALCHKSSDSIIYFNKNGE